MPIAAASSPAPQQRALYQTMWSPWVKPWLERVPVVRRIYSGWGRAHPFDERHGVDASGFLSAAECARGSALTADVHPYGGSQPSIVRAALQSLPSLEEYAFVDLGCGKGRPLVVASEFPFRRVVGVELSAQLADVARANAAIIAAREPGRPAIEIETGDATAVHAHAPCVVYFLYNSFGRSLVEALVQNLVRQLGQGLEHAFLVYYNPVHSAVLDQSPAFARWSAASYPYADDELGYGPDIEDTVVIWQSRPERHPARPGARRAVVVNRGGWCNLGK